MNVWFSLITMENENEYIYTCFTYINMKSESDSVISTWIHLKTTLIEASCQCYTQNYLCTFCHQSLGHVRLFVTHWTVTKLTPFEHRIFQARMLEWVAMLSSTGSFWPRDQTHVFCVSCIAGRFFNTTTAWEACYVVWKCTKGWYVAYGKQTKAFKDKVENDFQTGLSQGCNKKKGWPEDLAYLQRW